MGQRLALLTRGVGRDDGFGATAEPPNGSTIFLDAELIRTAVSGYLYPLGERETLVDVVDLRRVRTCSSLANGQVVDRLGQDFAGVARKLDDFALFRLEVA